MLRIDYHALCQKVATRLSAAGVPEDRAQIEAQIMAEADLLETPSHGVRMLPGLIKALQEQRLAPAPNMVLVREMAATCVMDCGNGPGRYGAYRAMNAATERAEQFGIGVCLAKNTSHWGRAHAYASRAAQAGFIGICTTNAMPTMAMGGATTPTIGNNPLAIGIPHRAPSCASMPPEEANPCAHEPVVMDMAMSQAAVGKVATWLREGRTPPANWGLDAQGKPSTNGEAILKGAVLPMGEHKGSALALIFELLTAALAGAAFSHQLYAKDQSGVDTHASKIFIALNVKAFIEPEEFNRQVSYYLNHLSDAAAPFQYPGERGWLAKRNNLAAGVPLHQEIVAQLAQVDVKLTP